MFGLPVAATLLTVAGCTSTDDASGALPAPTPSGQQAAHCRALRHELPSTVNELKRRTDRPDSDFTAAWGDTPITLRCGVPRPLVLTRGYKHYNPWSATVEINGVEWMPEQQPDGSLRCTTSKREAWVEVTVPKKYVGTGEFEMFTGLSDAVRKAVPLGVI